MTEKRFFILTDDEYDTRPCIRDRIFKINDIYGDYKYDDLEEICNELNRLNDENEQLKQTNQELYDELQETMGYLALKSSIEKENDELKQSISHYANIAACSIQVMNEDEELKKDYASILCTQMEELVKENEQLRQTLEDLRTYSNDEIEEAEHINTIYKKQGFKGVIDYAKDKLQNYGVVREVENGLWVMVTGGWSDNEFWLHCLNNPVSVFGMKHYRGYLRGGAFYYTEKPRGDVEIVLKGDVE